MSTTHLTAEEVAAYQRDGFLTPRRVLSTDEARHYRDELEKLERSRDDAVALRTDLHVLCNWAWDLVHDPRIVDPVSDVLGPNVLLWSLNWFIKEPRDGKFVSYHQDATYWGLEPHDVVTAWVALSDAGPATGPMKFIPGSHRGELYTQTDTFAADNLLSRGQVVDTEIDEASAVLAPLAAGEMSLHHVRLLHASDRNETDDRRIGLVLRYCATHVRQTKIEDTATLVKGRDDYGHFQLLERPREELGERELAIHRDAMRRMHRALHSADYE